jgi:hypothetical protein
MSLTEIIARILSTLATYEGETVSYEVARCTFCNGLSTHAAQPIRHADDCAVTLARSLHNEGN